MDGSLDLELSCQYYNDTSHLKENCIKLIWQLALEKKKAANNNNTTNAAGQPPSATSLN